MSNFEDNEQSEQLSQPVSRELQLVENNFKSIEESGAITQLETGLAMGLNIDSEEAKRLIQAIRQGEPDAVNFYFNYSIDYGKNIKPNSHIGADPRLNVTIAAGDNLTFLGDRAVKVHFNPHIAPGSLTFEKGAYAEGTGWEWKWFEVPKEPPAK